ncbi:putative PPC domain-containing protein [Rosa chinensis]|uniref:AT-hook motif nuclear-localized protein n=1 Tax=Rosa chinensis TaxID=74649 RepID=A0A2P6R5P3_ROSCH|nr:AT-hook motif nuclear-localized protein 14 [Rosa chinensis]PRQ41746.1 putative PPC domain-containing protein [Rosa chinensis]
MEPNEHQLSSYFNPTTTAAALSPTNGLAGGPNTQQQLSSADNNNNMVYTPHSSSAAAVPPPSSALTSPLEPAKRKRGRPRKYGTPEQALAAKKAATTSSHSSSSKEKKEQQLHQQQQQQHGGGSASPSYSGSTKKSQLSALGNSGQGFTPHVLTVAPGEDVGQKIMVFMQQNKRDICILSASGSISNASIRQPATSGGNITYEGRFEIISLSGSYVTDQGGKTGGLSVCLSNTNGQIIGGGVGGPLKAAGPVQVIVGTFLIDNKKEKVEVSMPRMPSPGGGASMMNVGFRSTVDSSGRNMVRANDEQQAIGGSHFMIQGMHGSTDWRTGPDARSTGAYELAGRGGRAAHQSPENGDYDQIPD